MKPILIVFIFLSFTGLAQEATGSKKHDLYLSTYIYSYHWTDRTDTGEKFNETHKAYGLEYNYEDSYSLNYTHFLNSRNKEVDMYAIGYIYNLYEDSFGVQIIGGYQDGYCFDGLLKSVECTENKNPKSTFILPLIYYKNDYIKIDFFSDSHMITFILNLKISNLF